MLRHVGPTARLRRAKRAKRQREARSVYQLVDARDGHVCRCCGVFCGERRELHHILYRSKGGTESTGNLVTLCSWRAPGNPIECGCHAMVHAGRLLISGDADHELSFERVD